MTLNEHEFDKVYVVEVLHFLFQGYKDLPAPTHLLLSEQVRPEFDTLFCSDKL